MDIRVKKEHVPMSADARSLITYLKLLGVLGFHSRSIIAFLAKFTFVITPI